MANKYFNWPGSLRRFVRFDAARSEDVNDALDEVSTAMDGVEVDTKRSIKLPASGADHLVNMAPELRANLLLGFDPSGAVAALPGGGRFTGDWAAGKAYLVSETFRDPSSKNIYSASVAHTSTTIASDLVAGKIRLTINVVDVEAAKQAASASAAIATTQAELAATNGAAQVALAAGQATLATSQADLAMGYRNTAGMHATTATGKAAQADAAAVMAVGAQSAAQSSAADAAIDAQRAEDAAASIADGPVTRVNTKTGDVTLFSTDIAPAATTAEMQAGTEVAYRSMSPALVAQAIAALAKSKIVRSTRTANTALSAADNGKLIDITAGTWTQTFAAAALLGSGWWCYIRNGGTGDITLDPNASELIDGLTSYVMYPGEMRLVQCDGTALRTVVINSFYRVFTTSDTFIHPPGYSQWAGFIWGAGGGGGKGNSGYISGGGGGGACHPFTVRAQNSGGSAVTIGAGGSGSSAGGFAGGVGGASIFLNRYAYGGGGGIGGVGSGGMQGSGGGGGGISGAGGNGVSGNGGSGGAPSSSFSSSSNDSGFGGSLGSVDGITSGVAAYGGGGGRYGAVGGDSVYGGGGGGGVNGTANYLGAQSTFGGSGGNGSYNSTAGNGVAPGGGGGATLTGNAGAGARGELRIWGVI